MSRALLAGIFVLVLACGPGDGGEPKPRAEAPPPAPSQVVRSDDEGRPPQPADFSDCPDAGEPREFAVPATGTRIRWCEREAPGGESIRHGPFEKVQNDVVVERGAFADGARHGRWTLYWSSGGRQSEGDYRHGRRSGPWTFWREDGTLIRRIDYAEPEAEGTDLAKPTHEGAGEVTLEIDNTRATPLVFRIDPFTQAWSIPPGGRFEVRSRGDAAGRIRIEADEEGLTVWPDPAAETVLLADGEELER